MKVKKYTIEEIYLKLMEVEFKQKKVNTEQSNFVYFASYYINKFLNTNLNIKSYIGIKRKEQTKDVFVLTVPFDILKNKNKRKVFIKYFESGIRDKERYIGLIQTPQCIGFLFKHDDELLNAHKTGQYSKISEIKKATMKKFRVIDYDIKVRAFYIVGGQNNSLDDWKNYPLGKRDWITYELFKMIYPDFFYQVLAEQFNVKTDYLKKNQVQILPKPNIENMYLELSEKDELYWFDKK